MFFGPIGANPRGRWPASEPSASASREEFCDIHLAYYAEQGAVVDVRAREEEVSRHDGLALAEDHPTSLRGTLAV
jgi:hypothetical protein